MASPAKQQSILNLEPVWPREDVLAPYVAELNYQQILELRRHAQLKLDREFWHDARKLLQQLPYGDSFEGPIKKIFSDDSVQIGEADTLPPASQEGLLRVIERLSPWRKGPFNLFGVEIDAEWRSCCKWDRIAPQLQSVRGKKVADVGCGNGYYMFRASSLEPELLIGFDPSEHFYYQMELVQRFAQNSAIRYEPYGIEHLSLYPGFFDVILCLGVLYHQRNPLEQAKLLFEALAPGGEIIVESQTIPGEEPVSLFTPGRYGKSRNVYFIPTASCLAAWLERTGFVDVEIFSHLTLSVEEQRRTPYAPFESLSDFLDPNDLSRTVEGYPAPMRTCVKAWKRVK